MLSRVSDPRSLFAGRSATGFGYHRAYWELLKRWQMAVWADSKKTAGWDGSIGDDRDHPSVWEG